MTGLAEWERGFLFSEQVALFSGICTPDKRISGGWIELKGRYNDLHSLPDTLAISAHEGGCGFYRGYSGKRGGARWFPDDRLQGKSRLVDLDKLFSARRSHQVNPVR
jgi:hypothetical protein